MQRYRVILRDNIEGITNNAIMRIIHKAGGKSCTGPTYNQVRNVLKEFMKELVKNIVAITEYSNRKTISADDVVEGARTIGIKYYRTGNEAKLKLCKLYDGVADPIARIKFYQRQSECLLIQRQPFERLIREIAQEFGEMKITADALGLIQVISEDHLFKILQAANLCAIHAGRQTIQPKDLQLVERISNDLKAVF